MSVRRMTNSIRRGAATSLLIHGEVRNSLDTLAWWKAMFRQPTWLETVGNKDKALSFSAIASKWGGAGLGKRVLRHFEIASG